LHPQYIQTIQTYFQYADVQIEVIPTKEYKLDVEDVRKFYQSDVAGVVVQYPNYFGYIEDLEGIKDSINDAKMVVVCNPITLGLLEAPGNLKADIVVGEAQPLGMPLSFGGPYLGYMCVKEALVRKLPGRIVGQTVDEDGKRAFTLTLQAREQHIRREKASSSICSNQALCALTAAVYLTAMGPQGLQDVAQGCYNNAHYLQEELEKIGLTPVNQYPYFHEFVTATKVSSDVILSVLEKNHILGGYPLDEHHILWCATEVNTKEEIDRVVSLLKEVCA